MTWALDGVTRRCAEPFLRRKPSDFDTLSSSLGSEQNIFVLPIPKCVGLLLGFLITFHLQ